MKIRIPFSISLLLACSPLLGVPLDVRDFGAAGDGETNDSPAIQRALDEAGETGGEVLIPAGRYRLDGELRVPPGVALTGSWQGPHHSEMQKGTTLLAYAGKGSEEGPALIHLMPNSTVRGVTIFYPEQRLPEIIPYPWTIQGQGNHCNVLDVTLVNPYKGIDFGEFANELHHIRNVFGTPLKAGIHIDRCTDIGRIENVHFNPHYWGFWGIPSETDYRPNWQDLLDYLFENCIAFSFGRTDWEYVFNTFSFGCKVGYHFYESEHGSANGNFLGIGADWAKTAVLVEQTQPPGLLITNGEFVGGTGSEFVIDILNTHAGVVQFANSSFWGPQQIIVRADGTGFVSLSQCNFQNWDHRDEGLPAILIKGGEANISHSFFRQNKPQIVLEEQVETAVIAGNRFYGDERIVNRSGGDVQTGLNVIARRDSAPPGEPLPDPFGEWSFQIDPPNRGHELDLHLGKGEGWSPVKVPGSWHDVLESPYYGYAWYRTTFTLPEETPEEGVVLRFDGVDEQAWIYVNGEKAGEHSVESERRPVSHLWDRPFHVEVPSALLRAEEENLLVVRVHASAGQAGIWRPVRIYSAPPDPAP